MTWTIWYDSYYYDEEERLHNVIGEYLYEDDAIAAMNDFALNDMREFIIKSPNAWVIINDAEEEHQTSFTLGIRPDPEDAHFDYKINVEYKVIEIDRLPAYPMEEAERQTILQLLKHHSDGMGETIYCADCNKRVPVFLEDISTRHMSGIPDFDGIWADCPDCGITGIGTYAFRTIPTHVMKAWGEHRFARDGGIWCDSTDGPVFISGGEEE